MYIGAVYIGETGRKLRVRLSEHQRSCQQNLEVEDVDALAQRNQRVDYGLLKHFVEFGHDMRWEAVEILAMESNLRKRRLLESIYIKEHRKLAVQEGFLIMNMRDSVHIPELWRCLD